VYKSSTMSILNGVKNILLKEKREEVRPVNGKDQSRNTLIDQRRALGLCFKCRKIPSRPPM
jgi:hypothetical protein